MTLLYCEMAYIPKAQYTPGRINRRYFSAHLAEEELITFTSLCTLGTWEVLFPELSPVHFLSD